MRRMIVTRNESLGLLGRSATGVALPQRVKEHLFGWQAIGRLLEHHRLEPVYDVRSDLLVSMRGKAVHEDRTGLRGGH